MTTIQEQRECAARIIGAKLANEFADDQLPAILHAINNDEHEVRIVAQKVTRSANVDNPAGLMMWMLRTQRHTNLLPAPEGARVYDLPPLPDEAELAARRETMREWKKILTYIQRHQDCKDLFNELRSTYPNDSEAHIIHETMLHVIDAMEAQA